LQDFIQNLTETRHDEKIFKNSIAGFTSTI